ncbi:Aldo-ket-red domain-containing protein [Mycena chlorophos]|uniref:Aldo-ket-red domain-containing protein n=1 Tax=Mycena chlorophos TaxID=658473 RepID=A0A8H6VS53_MYCCL|nr:Aldo-ket-red domain-containing protein [Mycena chlorophos]
MAMFAPAPAPKTKLGHYRVLSPNAGIHVSPIQLGAANIGDKWASMGWGAMDKESSFKLLDAYVENGGNFIDTANGYQDETSEAFIGEWMETRGIRDQLVVATKYSSNFKRGQSGFLNQASYSGNNLKSMTISVEASLKKLRTSYIDLFYVHYWDWDASVEEVMNGLHNLVVQGKVLYLGISDAPAWVVAQANQYAKDHGKTPFAVYQGRWNVMERAFEREILPMARAHGLALAPWDVLAGGKFRTDAEEQARRESGEKGRTAFDPNWERNENEIKVSHALEKVAGEVGAKSIQAVAIAYVMHKAPYVFPIIGGRKIEHLLANVEALDIALSPEQIAFLEDTLPFDVGFPECSSYVFNILGGLPQRLTLDAGRRKEPAIPLDLSGHIRATTASATDSSDEGLIFSGQQGARQASAARQARPLALYCSSVEPYTDIFEVGGDHGTDAEVGQPVERRRKRERFIFASFRCPHPRFPAQNEPSKSALSVAAPTQQASNSRRRLTRTNQPAAFKTTLQVCALVVVELASTNELTSSLQTVPSSVSCPRPSESPSNGLPRLVIGTDAASGPSKASLGLTTQNATSNPTLGAVSPNQPTALNSASNPASPSSSRRGYLKTLEFRVKPTLTPSSSSSLRQGTNQQPSKFGRGGLECLRISQTRAQTGWMGQVGASRCGEHRGQVGIDGMGAMDKESSFKLLDAYVENGGNFIDTANGYQDETSEAFIGEWMETRGIRDQLVVATKYSSNFKRGQSGFLNQASYSGNNLKSMTISVEASLKKLRTVEEVMNGLHNLVGRARCYIWGSAMRLLGLSRRRTSIAKDHGKTPFAVYQGRWNVMERAFEREILPMARAHGLALAPWDVLAAGKFRTDAEEQARRESGEKGRTAFDPNWERNENEVKVSHALEKVAGEVGAKSIQAECIVRISIHPKPHPRIGTNPIPRIPFTPFKSNTRESLLKTPLQTHHRRPSTLNATSNPTLGVASSWSPRKPTSSLQNLSVLAPTRILQTALSLQMTRQGFKHLQIMDSDANGMGWDGSPERRSTRWRETGLGQANGCGALTDGDSSRPIIRTDSGADGLEGTARRRLTRNDQRAALKNGSGLVKDPPMTSCSKPNSESTPIVVPR